MKQISIFKFSASQRKTSLISHITFSIGWFGAVVVFLFLAIKGLSTLNNQTARACYIAMEICTWYVILPFCIFSLLTGIIQGLGTRWGLFSHYWIVVKLILTLISTLLLILHLKPISDLVIVTSNSSMPNSEYANQVLNLISKSGAAILVLLFIISISVFKPWGKIKMSENKISNNNKEQEKPDKTKMYLMIGLGAFILFVVVKHIISGGLSHH